MGAIVRCSQGVASRPMYMPRGAARSDTILAPAGILVGVGALSLVLGVVQDGLSLAGASLTTFAVLTLRVVPVAALVIGWPMWLARTRGDTVTGSASVPGDLAAGAVAALPMVVAGIAIPLTWGQGVGRSLVGIGGAALWSLPEGAILLAQTIAMAVGGWLVTTLVARRAPQGWDSPMVRSNEVLRSWALGAIGLATVLLLLQALATSVTALSALLVGIGVAGSVVLADRLVPAAALSRPGALAPGIALLVLWLVGGRWFLGQRLFDSLAAGLLAVPVALAIGQLAEARRPWAGLPLAVALALWLGAGLIPL